MNNSELNAINDLYTVWNIHKCGHENIIGYLLNWSVKYYNNQCFPDDTYLTHKGVRYEIIRINNINSNCSKIALSFRRHLKENTNIVLVKGIF
mgnify:CR=1 FL=1